MQEDGLDFCIAYALEVDNNDWGSTWLGSITRLYFSTEGEIYKADLDGDSDVDGIDLSIFEAAFGSTSGNANYNSDADFNEDDIIDLNDLSQFSIDFGKTECEIIP